MRVQKVQAKKVKIFKSVEKPSNKKDQMLRPLADSYWNRMKENPGYKIMKKWKYNGWSGLGPEGKEGWTRPLDHERYMEKVPMIRDHDPEFEPNESKEPNADIDKTSPVEWEEFNVDKEWARYRKWFKDCIGHRKKDSMAHRYAETFHDSHDFFNLHDCSFFFQLEFLDCIDFFQSLNSIL